MRVDTIVVPLDGTGFAHRALPVALRLARRLGAGIHLFSAVEAEADVPEREAELHAVDVGALRVGHTVVVDLDPAGAIHEALKRLGPAAACMSSHGRGRSAALVGSVATEVIVRGRDPLVVVGPLVVTDDREGQELLACVDETPAAAALLPIALDWAGTLGVPLAVATVAEPVPDPVRPGPAKRRFGPDGDVDAYLAAVVAPFAGFEHGIRALCIWDPISPAEGVRSFLRDHPVLLGAASTRGPTGLERALLGSTAAAIVHHSPDPVLLVPRMEP
jgi:nucleotide-binding universal stress UspA family protein